MSRFFSLCKANKKSYSVKNNFNSMKQKTAKPNQRWNYYVSLSLVLVIMLLAGFYLVRVTSAATDGFKISDQEVKIKDLKLTNQILKEQVNNLTNLAALQTKALANGLTAATQIDYLSIKDIDVAVK